MHHKFSDTPNDPHTPIHKGFWYAHIGWLIDENNTKTNLDSVKDLAKYKELVWINKYHYIFPYILMTVVYTLGEYTNIFGNTGLGFSAVVWVFFFSTALSIHATFTVNTLTHGIYLTIVDMKPMIQQLIIGYYPYQQWGPLGIIIIIDIKILQNPDFSGGSWISLT